MEEWKEELRVIMLSLGDQPFIIIDKLK